jgi:superfamily II DNA or RNA helicase
MLTIEVLNAVECRIETKYKQVIKPCLSFPSEYWKQGPFKKERIEYTKDVFYLNSRGYSYFRTGLIPRVITFLNNKGFPYKIEREKSFNGLKVLTPFLPGITFRQDQLELINTIHIPENNFRGMIVSPTGSGKTILQLGIISTFPENCTVLILAHTLSLIEQTYQELLKYNFKNVQPITGLTSKELTGRIVVSTIQSFSNIDPNEYMDYFYIVICDEVHHSHSDTYSSVLKYLLAPIRLGFTATMPKNKKHLLTIEGLIGPLIGELTIDQAKEIDILAKPKINIIKTTLDWNIKREKNYHRVYETGIVSNIGRNRRIINLAQKYSKENKSTLIMVSKIEHGNNLLNMARTSGLDIEFVNGDMPSDEREQIKKRITNKELLCIICTTVWKEGINIPSLDTIINAAGGKSEIATLQTIGRGLRKTKDKDIVTIVDFFDPSNPFLVEHFGERLCLYYEMGWL